MNMSTSSPVFSRMSAAGEQQPSAHDVIHLMRSHIWKIVVITVCITILAVAYAFLASPIYSADVLVRVDPPESNAFGVVPQTQVLNQLAAQPTDAEIAIMQSRSVIDPVLQQYKFNVVAKPHVFPLLSILSELFATPGVPSGPWFYLDSFAWGGEQIDITSLNVPSQFEDKNLDLIALGNDRYQLLDEAGNVLLTGTVGVLAQANDISLLVNRLVARPLTRFDVRRYNEINAIRRFQNSLKISDDGRSTGVVRVTFSDPSPIVATGVANAIAQSYIAASIASRQANDGKTLAFIDQELPRLRTDLLKDELALSEFQRSSVSMSPMTEAQAYLQSDLDFQRQIAALTIQRIQLLTRFTADSPEIKNIDQQIDKLNGYETNYHSQFVGMPKSAQENADLTRNTKNAETIYTAMANKQEELLVQRAGATGNAHIVDAAVRPSLPFKPNRLLVISGGFGFGLLVGMAYVFIRYQVFGGVIDPNFVENYLSVPLLGSLSFSHNQESLEMPALAEPQADRDLGWRHADSISMSSGGGTRLGLAKTRIISSSLPASAHRLLSRSFPHDISIEALRYVRTALHIEMAQAPNNIVALTGPTVATGKSFVAANLAVLQAEAGLRVLLIDADMRCGRLASFFKQFNAGGLADVLRGDLQLHAAIRPVGIENLSFMSCGSYPSNPSELLAKNPLNKLLGGLESQFDLVIVDTPPFLPVTDAAIVAHQAGATLMVLRSGTQTKQEVTDTVSGLDRTGARLIGAIFNGMPARYGIGGRYDYEPIARHAYNTNDQTVQAA